MTHKILIIIFLFLSIAFSENERWVYRYNGPVNGADFGYSLVYGTDGNIYAVGFSPSGGSLGEVTVISLTPNRNERWIYHHNRLVNSSEDTRSIFYGADENIYIAGFTADTNWAHKFSVISLTAGGSERWVYRYGQPNTWGRANSLVYGADGNIYAGGLSYIDTNTTSNGFTVISLTPNGTERWAYQYNHPSNNIEQALSIVYGADGNIYAGGESYDSLTGRDFTIISLTSDGIERWVYRYNGTANDDDRAYSLIFGTDGNIYAAGSCYDSITRLDFTVISITPEGSQRWIYQYNGSGNGNDGAISLIYGSDENIYAGGWCYDSITGADFTVISLTSDGIERWSYRYNNPSNLGGSALSITTGADGNIYAGGESRDSITGSDFTVISLTSDGIERWVYRYNGTGNGYDVANSLIYGNDGNIYAVGESWGSSSHNDFIIISLNPTVGIEEKFTTIFPSFSVHGLGRKVAFSLFLSRPTTVPISLYNISGERLFSFEIHAPKGISHHQKDLHFLPSGVYFLQTDFEGWNTTKKCIIFK